MSGTSAWIGELDDNTVLKHPLAPGGDMGRLEIERQVLELIGPHERITQLTGANDIGLYLDCASNGTLGDYLLEAPPERAPPSTSQRVAWSREASEVVGMSIELVYCTATSNPVACFLWPTWKHVAANGTILIEGLSSDLIRFSCLRDDPHEADIKTDLFALGCTIYFVMMSHAVYPSIVDGSDEWYEEFKGDLPSNSVQKTYMLAVPLHPSAGCGNMIRHKNCSKTF